MSLNKRRNVLVVKHVVLSCREWLHWKPFSRRRNFLWQGSTCWSDESYTESWERFALSASNEKQTRVLYILSQIDWWEFFGWWKLGFWLVLNCKVKFIFIFKFLFRVGVTICAEWTELLDINESIWFWDWGKLNVQVQPVASYLARTYLATSNLMSQIDAMKEIYSTGCPDDIIR